MISIQSVTKRFGRSIAVNDVSLEIQAGDSIALWGANGAGKTTLLRCVLGLVQFRGNIRVGGFDIRKKGKAARQLIGYVPQEISFYDDLGVGEAIHFFSRLKGLFRIDAGETLERVGLAGSRRKRVRELSGGMKQRLALAIALLGDPPVLLLDEVTASLDAVGREEFVGLLERLSGSGRTLLFASHRIDEVATLARRVAQLDLGRLTGVAASEDFLGQIGHGSQLHIFLAAEHRSRALRYLQDGGYAARMNGAGVIVPVAPEQKARPFRLLADADIAVQDFELISLSQAASSNSERGSS